MDGKNTVTIREKNPRQDLTIANQPIAYSMANMLIHIKQ